MGPRKDRFDILKKNWKQNIFLERNLICSNILKIYLTRMCPSLSQCKNATFAQMISVIVMAFGLKTNKRETIKMD